MDEAVVQLGAMLRAWRGRLSPADVGMLGGLGRRTPGLRREEVAALAGMSVDYLVRLEQGRAKPSAQVVEAIARSLQLTVEERDHLYRLAGHQPPAPDHVPTAVPAEVQRLVTRLGDNAISVFAADWTLITWTPLWAALMGDPSSREPCDMNLLRVIFRRDDTNASFGDHPARVLSETTQYRADLVADLRAATGRYPRDPRLAALVAELKAESPEFAKLWKRGAVARHDSTRKVISHPIGDITMDCDTITVPGADLRILVYTAAEGTRDSELIDFLRVTRPASVVDRLR
ncbi:helix-turn-helix domain-containing protein [Streptomyces sp. NPDC006923]|uniref:helix-turn-helix domain-containing protein n=1 Tax=Streptomyces sp. NPDC006923 TaxID=3155355 RepID=UPI0033CDDAA8